MLRIAQHDSSVLLGQPRSTWQAARSMGTNSLQERARGSRTGPAGHHGGLTDRFAQVEDFALCYVH